MRLYELNNHDLLYIPHGSDERRIEKRTNISTWKLYIPHGSDERIFMRFINNNQRVLYIPHGSDERLTGL